MPKVTRRGGGSALPWRINLFDDLVRSAVRAADGQLPVTVKMRLGVDADHLTYRDAALRAQDAGVGYVALHGRTAADFYGGQADWQPIAELAELLDIPVLGNGDIWEAADAIRMVRADRLRRRGGRPGLPGPAVAVRRPGRGLPGPSPAPRCPALAEVVRAMYRHAELLCEWLGSERGVVDFRKHVAWYLKGFSVGSEHRRALAMASSLAELADLLAQLDQSQPFPAEVLGQPRGPHHRRPQGGAAGRLAGRPGVPAGALRRRTGRLRRLTAQTARSRPRPHRWPIDANGSLCRDLTTERC